MDAKSLEEKQISSEELFHGVMLHVYKDMVQLPNGKEGVRELIRHLGAVAVVAVTDEGNVIIEHQYRYPQGRVFVEIPAGKLDSKEEDHLKAAQRELREETGILADEWTFMGSFTPACAYCDEVIDLYLARKLHKGAQDLDEDEFLEVEEIPLEELVDQIMNGTITDGKTVAAVLKADRILNTITK